jgi:hypothetical protein
MVTPHQLGVTLGESRTQREGEHQDQDYSRQTVVGNQPILVVVCARRSRLGTFGGRRAAGRRTRLVLCCGRVGAMSASVQEAMLERPVLRQIVPAVVFLFPA